MRSLLTFAACLVAIVACQSRRSASPAPPEAHTQKTVFTDSLMHAERCEPLKAGENWRDVCTPRDQSVRAAVPKLP
jgi:hypothetical protein